MSKDNSYTYLGIDQNVIIKKKKTHTHTHTNSTPGEIKPFRDISLQEQPINQRSVFMVLGTFHLPYEHNSPASDQMASATWALRQRYNFPPTENTAP